MKLIVQIPCYNEEKNLARTVADIPRQIDGIDKVEILIIDDGSTDRTVKVAEEIGVDYIVRNSINIGLSRVPGVELMENICELAAHQGYKVFIYGAREDVNKSTVEKLKKQYPGLQIAGRSNGYVSEEKMPGLIDRINKSQAEIFSWHLARQSRKNGLPPINIL